MKERRTKLKNLCLSDYFDLIEQLKDYEDGFVGVKGLAMKIHEEYCKVIVRFTHDRREYDKFIDRLVDEKRRRMRGKDEEPKPNQYCMRDEEKVFGCDGERTDKCLGCIPTTFIMEMPEEKSN